MSSRLTASSLSWFWIKLTILSLFVQTSVFAFAGNNGCEQLGVQVLNKTGNECIFQGFKMLQGKLIDVVPNVTVLQPNNTQTFLTIQNLVQGPDIVLQYLCGGQRISIESQQNYCFNEAGLVRGSITDSSGQLQASHMQNEGSFYFSAQGNIYWALYYR